MLHKCFILGGILQTYSTHTSVACDFMMGVAVVPTGMLTCRKRGLGERKAVLFAHFARKTRPKASCFCMHIAMRMAQIAQFQLVYLYSS